jgi:hypothetical protein
MERQKQILEVFKGDTKLILRKSEIKVRGNIDYFNNTDKYLGETLTRMVKNGSLIRISIGNYKLGSGDKMIVQPKNQMRLL